MAEAYPLDWPSGYPRTAKPKNSAFKVSFAVARDGIFREIKALGGTLPVLSTNVKLRDDGMPYASKAQVSKVSNNQDPGVAVYFMFRGKQVVLACDKWHDIPSNARAIEKAISAMRGLERWGVSEILDRAFSGFTALPAPGYAEAKPWYVVLDIPRNSDVDAIEKAYKAKVRKSHPDVGGSHEAMSELNWAITEARSEKG